MYLVHIDTSFSRVHLSFFKEKDFEETKASGNISQWKTELEESLKEKRQIDSELSRLREEQQMMHLQSTAQAKLDMSRKQKDTNEDTIQKM